MTTLRFLIILLLVLNALAFAAVRGWLGNAPPAGEPERIAAQLHPERIRLAREVAPPPQRMADAVGQGLSATLPLPEPAETPFPPTADPAPATTAPDDAVLASSAPAGSVPANPDPAPDENAGETAPAESPEGAIAPGSAEPPAQPAADEVGTPGVSAATDAAQDGSTEPAAEVSAADAGPPAVCQAWANLTADQADRLSQRLRRIGVTPIRSRTETPDSWWVRIAPQRTRADAERRVVELNLLGVTDTFIVQDPGPTQYAVSLGVFKTENRARVLLGQLRERGVSNAGLEPRMTTTYRIQADLPAGEMRAVESAAPGLRARRQSCNPR